MNSSGLPIFASYSFGGLGLDAFRRAVPFVQHLVQAIVDGSVHFDLRGDVGNAEHGTLRGNDLRIAVAAARRHALNALKPSHNAANPASGPPIDHRPVLSVCGIAHRKDILLQEADVEIAVRVRRV